MYIRSLAGALFMTLPTMAWAACFASPTWQDQPLHEEYIEQIEPLQGLRHAHLKTSNLAHRSANERRMDLRRHLISAALLQHEGDRSAFRKTLVNGTMLDIVQSIDVSRLQPLGRARMIEIYWLNGCTEEALNHLEADGSLWSNHNFLPIASGNAPLIFKLAERVAEEGNDYLSNRLQAFGSLLDNPEMAAETLGKFLNYILTNNESRPNEELADFAGLTLALSLVKDKGPTFEPPMLPPNPSQLDLQNYYIKWISVAAWASVAGHCDEVEQLTVDLLEVPHEGLSTFRALLEATAIHCFALPDE